MKGSMVIMVLVVVFQLVSGANLERAKCERIEHEMCTDLPYNLTSFPNVVGEETMKDASESISTYKPLLSVVCSEQLKFFLCSVYFPMCNEKIPQPIGPCRPLCLSVKEKCLPILEGFGFTWPDAIRCDKFPLENNREKMCMKGPNENGAIQDERSAIRPTSHEMHHHTNANNPRQKCANGEVYINKTAKCVPLCLNSPKISQTERDASTKLLMFLATSSVIMTLLTIFVVVISKFAALSSLPDSSIFFSSIAFTLTSAVYVFSVSFREQISCIDYTHHHLFVTGGLSHVPCSSIASLIYYLSTCARLWWVVLCFTWNRTTRTANIMEDASARVHMLIWGIPLAPLMLALLAKSISANLLTGICHVGSSTTATDWVFNFTRELLLFLLATVALSAGCCRLLASSDHTNINGFAGIVAALYPIASLFYLLSFINDATQPGVGWDKTLNIVSGLKFSFDLVLSLIMCAFCFIYFLSRVSSKSSSPKISKNGYQPAVPKMPQPSIPGSVRSNTYASSFRNNMI